MPFEGAKFARLDISCCKFDKCVLDETDFTESTAGDEPRQLLVDFAAQLYMYSVIMRGWCCSITISDAQNPSPCQLPALLSKQACAIASSTTPTCPNATFLRAKWREHLWEAHVWQEPHYPFLK
jgi:hypothetical protein